MRSAGGGCAGTRVASRRPCARPSVSAGCRDRVDPAEGTAMAMTKSEKIWMNGQFVAWDDAKVHVLSHVLHYGSSVFEGIRCYNTKQGPAIFRLGEHIERLAYSAKIYRMKVPFSSEQIERACIDTVATNRLAECYI